MSLMGWIAISFFLAVGALALWALWHQSRALPPGTKITGEPHERERGLRWIGWWMTGGHG
jgi:hypothetical protein